MFSRFERSRRVTRAAAAALVATALVLTSAACGGGSDGGSSSAATELKLAVRTPLSSFDPAQLTSGEGHYIWGGVYDTLLRLDIDGTLKPNAAKSWKYSPDGRTLTLKLRQGMKFSNDEPVNAAAVKATLDRIQKVPGPQFTQMLNVTSIEAPDDSTVVVTFKQPDTAFVGYLADAGGVIVDPAGIAKSGGTLDPVSSGPYTLDKAATVNGSTYVLKRRDDYWNKDAHPFPSVTVRVIPDSTAALNALRSGQLNASSVDTRQTAQLKPAGFTITRNETTAIAELIIADRAGTTLKPLGDLRVRQAINLAFDRQKFVQALFNNVGKPTAQVFHPNSQAHDAALDKTYPFDVAQAKQLMTAAGYPSGFDVTMPSFAYTKPLEPSVAQALGDIGIRVKWAAVPFQNLFGELAAKKYPMFLFLNGLGTAARDVAQHYSPIGYLNPFRSTDPKLNQLLGQVGAEQDPAKAEALYQQINAFVVQNAWNAPIAYSGNEWATKGIKYTLAALPTTNLRQFTPAA